jgi:exodeoxyribonuclease-3
MSQFGWTDLWRRFNGNAKEYTWYSKRKGGVPRNGFRIDHAFASPAMLPRVVNCRYSHEEREAGVSDHSVLVLEIA